MTKFVILGSRRFAPYEVTFTPLEMPNVLDEEERFQVSIKKSHPAMDEADVIMVYAPDGVGIHTRKDMAYARNQGKQLYRILPVEED